MKDELDDIKQRLRHTPAIKINLAAKKAAISLALRGFDKNNSEVSQATTKSVRLKSTTIFRSTAIKTYQIAVIGTFCALFVVWAVVPMQRFTDFGQVLNEPTDSSTGLRLPQPLSAEKRTILLLIHLLKQSKSRGHQSRSCLMRLRRWSPSYHFPLPFRLLLLSRRSNLSLLRKVQHQRLMMITKPILLQEFGQ